MADEKTTGLARATNLTNNDEFMTVDVSDTSMAASGTNKKASPSLVRSIISDHTPVGQDEEYTTIFSARGAGKTRIIVTTAITETQQSTLTPGTDIVIPNGLTVNFGAFCPIIAGAFGTVTLRGRGSVVMTPTENNTFLFSGSGINVLLVLGGGIQILPNIGESVTGIRLRESNSLYLDGGTIFNMPNSSGFMVDFKSDDIINDVMIVGGGDNCHSCVNLGGATINTLWFRGEFTHTTSNITNCTAHTHIRNLILDLNGEFTYMMQVGGLIDGFILNGSGVPQFNILRPNTRILNGVINNGARGGNISLAANIQDIYLENIAGIATYTDNTSNSKVNIKNCDISNATIINSESCSISGLSVNSSLTIAGPFSNVFDLDASGAITISGESTRIFGVDGGAALSITGNNNSVYGARITDAVTDTGTGNYFALEGGNAWVPVTAYSSKWDLTGVEMMLTDNGRTVHTRGRCVSTADNNNDPIGIFPQGYRGSFSKTADSSGHGVLSIGTSGNDQQSIFGTGPTFQTGQFIYFNLLYTKFGI